MTDPRSNVRPGQSLSVAAAQINWINDQMRKGGVTQPPAESVGSPYTLVYGKNVSGSDAARWAVLTITGMEIVPTASDTDAATRQFCTMPVLSLDASTGTGKRCVAIEPIATGKIGRVAIAGAVQVKPDDIAKLDGATTLWSDENWALVRFGGDSVRLAKTSTEIDKGAFGVVSLYNNATEDSGCNAACEVKEFSPRVQQPLCVQNLLEKVPANCWVYIVKPEWGNIWHIVAREKLPEDDPDSEDNNDCGARTDHGVKLTFSACCGKGATAHGVVSGDCPGSISSVVVDLGGSGYARTGRVEPELTISGGGGTGATFTPSFTKTSGSCGDDTWTIASVSVSSGTGYKDGAKLKVTAQAGTTSVGCAELMLHVSGSEKVPSSVTVTDGGTFYKESDTATAYVPTITVNVESAQGSGAEFTAHVDDSPTSETFGQITSVTVDNAGSGYVGTVNSGATKWKGLDFSTIAGYDPLKTQMLGHSPGGCLHWFTTTSCDTDDSGVCCVDDAVNGTYTTRVACEAAGGTWKAGATASDLPGPCCPPESP